MKILLLLLALTAAFCLDVGATSLSLLTVRMPLYLHGADSDARITIVEVPVMNASSTNMAAFSAICHPFHPPSVSSWVKPRNVNIASEYGLEVSLDDSQKVNGVWHWIITVDAAAARVPEGYPFTVEQVIDSVITCVRLTTPEVPPSERLVTIEVKRPAK